MIPGFFPWARCYVPFLFVVMIFAAVFWLTAVWFFGHEIDEYVIELVVVFGVIVIDTTFVSCWDRSRRTLRRIFRRD